MANKTHKKWRLWRKWRQYFYIAKTSSQPSLPSQTAKGSDEKWEKERSGLTFVWPKKRRKNFCKTQNFAQFLCRNICENRDLERISSWIWTNRNLRVKCKRADHLYSQTVKHTLGCILKPQNKGMFTMTKFKVRLLCKLQRSCLAYKKLVTKQSRWKVRWIYVTENQIK